MFDLKKLTPDARAYFDTMPPLMRETLVQAGAPLTTRQELMDFVNSRANG